MSSSVAWVFLIAALVARYHCKLVDLFSQRICLVNVTWIFKVFRRKWSSPPPWWRGIPHQGAGGTRNQTLLTHCRSIQVVKLLDGNLSDFNIFFRLSLWRFTLPSPVFTTELELEWSDLPRRHDHPRPGRHVRPRHIHGAECALRQRGGGGREGEQTYLRRSAEDGLMRGILPTRRFGRRTDPSPALTRTLSSSWPSLWVPPALKLPLTALSSPP